MIRATTRAVRRPGTGWRILRAAACLLAALSIAAPAGAEDAPRPDSPAPDPDLAPRKYTFHQLVFDEDDGRFDVSNLLMRGGFIPIPVIVTQPAVGGGLGFILTFVTFPEDNPRHATRRALGGVRTRNGSFGYGYFQSGRMLDNRLSYAFGVGRGNLTIASYLGEKDIPVTYTSSYNYGVWGGPSIGGCRMTGCRLDRSSTSASSRPASICLRSFRTWNGICRAR